MVDSPNGPVQALKPPFAFADVEPVMSAVPAVGQHTEEILESLGYSSSDIVRMRADRIA